MDPITLIQTTWEVVRNLILEFAPNDKIPPHPNIRPHTPGNASANGALPDCIIYVDSELEHQHPHHAERQRRMVIHKLRELAKHDINVFGQLSVEQLTSLFVLGLFFVPATSAAVSLGLTVMTIGPIAEAATIEILANAAFVQAASRAGAVLYAGKALELNSIFAVSKLPNMLSHAELRYLKNFSVKNIVHQAERMGLDTPRDSFFLWTGFGKEGVSISQDFVKANGGMTLEMTPGGKWLNDLNLFADNSPFTLAERLEIWEKVSVAAVKRASGQVRSIVGVIKPKAIYQEELRAIDDNPLITGLDPLIIKPRVVLNGI